MELNISKSKRNVAFRLILALLIVSMIIFKLTVSYRGLNSADAMDQAQIARSVARGEGFTTKFLRPIELKSAVQSYKRAKGQSEAVPHALLEMKDTTHAPLNICALAVTLRLSGYYRFERERMDINESYLYGGDRVVSCTSMLLYCFGVVLAYVLIASIFDEMIACVTSSLMLLNEGLLDIAVSGTALPLMMCCFLGSLLFFRLAAAANEEYGRTAINVYLLLSAACLAMLCLSGWMGIWPTIGVIVCAGVLYRAKVGFGIPMAVVVLLALVVVAYLNRQASGSMLGTAAYALYEGFGGGADGIMRATTPHGLPFDSTNVMLRLCAQTLRMAGDCYEGMGAIFVAPFFLLALFNRFKRKATNTIKWVTFSAWSFGTLGMSVYGGGEFGHSSSLYILFVPVFCSFGLALIFNFLSRLRLEEAVVPVAKGLAVFFVVLMASGAFLASVPMSMYEGIVRGAKARPFYPPYLPPTLNKDLHDITRPGEVIVSDQPWAVAWYADRHSVWIPRSIADFVSIEKLCSENDVKVQGVLITASSHSDPELRGGLGGMMSDMGEFTPLAIEGKLLSMDPARRFLFADTIANAADDKDKSVLLSQVVSSQGRYAHRKFLTGAGVNMMYYSKEPIND